MKIYCSNKLYVEEPTSYIKQFVKDRLTFANPDYAILEKMGKWTGGTPKEIVLYEKIGDNLVLPFGVLNIVRNNFTDSSTKFYGKFANNGKRNIPSRIKLYDYQERVVSKALVAKNGVIVMPCGSGKTQSALELASRLGKRTLWLTHTQDLLNQSMERAKSCLDVPISEYGTITAGKVNIGNTITFATVQTMCNIKLEDYKYTFDVVIVDECHKCVGTPTSVMMFYKVVSSLSARYKFGITATPKRADGLERCMFALLGDKIDEVTKEEVKNTTCPIEVQVLKSSYKPDMNMVLAADGTIMYAGLIDDLINNKERNQLIVEDLRRRQGTCLILSDRLAHLDTLYKMLNCPATSEKLDGTSNTKASKENRKQVLSKLNNGLIKYVFATYKLAKEGLDIPTLRNLVLATPVKDPTTVQQSTGRVGRKAEGKSKGVVVDIVDDFGLLYGYYRKRKSIYKKLDYNLVDIY